MKIQGIIGVILAVLYIGFADVIAVSLGSPDLSPLMRISAGIIVAYSIYAVYIGSFNGRRLFGKQALFDISYATIKTILILSLAAAGFKVMGTVIGFLTAAIIIVIAAAMVAGQIPGYGSFPKKRYLTFASTLIFYTFLLNLVMSLDLFIIKSMTAESAIASGQTEATASEISKGITGQYGAAQALALIPYQVILAIAFVAFPMISRVTFAQDAEKTKAYIRKTLRFTTILIVGFASVFGALPSRSVRVMFPAEYGVAGDALGILAFGIAAFGIMVVSNTILNGASLPKRAMLVIVVTLAAVVGAVWTALTVASSHMGALAATALGTSLGMTIGLMVSAIVVYEYFGTFWPWPTVIRVATASTAAVITGHYLLPDLGKIVTIGECVLVLLLYYGVLVLTKEFKREDLTQLAQVVKRS
jgi:O-antigen/teichoic acid export membrane protein